MQLYSYSLLGEKTIAHIIVDACQWQKCKVKIQPSKAFERLEKFYVTKCWYFLAVGRKLKSSPITVTSVSGRIDFKDVDFERIRKFNSEFY